MPDQARCPARRGAASDADAVPSGAGAGAWPGSAHACTWCSARRACDREGARDPDRGSARFLDAWGARIRQALRAVQGDRGRSAPRAVQHFAGDHGDRWAGPDAASGQASASADDDTAPF
jgi:hypothetical protein